MQGGHGEGLHAFWSIWGPNAEDSGYESEVSVSQGISLGYRLDGLLHSVRDWTAHVLSLPVAWLHLEPTVDSFREHKFRRVKQGTETVLRLQRATRCFPATVVCSAISFCAEEEFYLLALPLTFWNISVTLGRQLTLMVCLGLVVGNIMKDVFRLPRPPAPPVWRPSHQAAVDSTALRDFGFPSTHSMNSLTNSAVVFLYAQSAGWLAGETVLQVGSLKLSLGELCGLGAVLLYTVSLCFSRIYLGAHSPTDLRGGLSLAGLMIAVLWPSFSLIDEWMMSATFLEAKCVLLAIVVLLLNPQPRPITPTFEQNALLVGLLIGCVIGSRYYYSSSIGTISPVLVQSSSDTVGVQWLSTGSQNQPVSVVPFQTDVQMWSKIVQQSKSLLATHPIVAGVVRTFIGYTLVLLLRVIVKKFTVSVLKVFGIHLQAKQAIQTLSKMNETSNDAGKELKQNDKTPETKKKKKQSKPRKHRVVRLFTRDIDIVGMAIVKTITYASLAFAITFVVPLIHTGLGIAVVTNAD